MITSAFTFWGQFIDHDIDLTEVTNEPMPIEIPKCDEFMDKECKGTYRIEFNRSMYQKERLGGERHQINLITSWIDASQVYGSDEETVNRLRSFE